MFGKRKIIFSSLLVLALASMLVVGVAQAQQRGGKGDPKHNCASEKLCRDGNRDFPMQRMAKELELTEDQIAKLEQMREAHRADCLPLRTEIQQMRLEMQKLRLDADPDRGAMVKLIRSMGDLRDDLKIKRLDHQLQMRGLLTDEQQVKMDAMRLHGRRDGRGDGYRGHHSGHRESNRDGRRGCLTERGEGGSCRPGCGPVSDSEAGHVEN